MYTQKTYNIVSALVYKLSLLLGIFPAPLRDSAHGRYPRKLSKSPKLYLVYSAVLHLLCVSALPCVFADIAYRVSQTHPNPVAWGAVHLVELLHNVYMLLNMREIWFRRNAYRRSYDRYRRWSKRMLALSSTIPSSRSTHEAITKRMQRFIVQNTCVISLIQTIGFVIVVLMRPINGPWVAFMFCARLQQAAMWLLPIHSFSLIVSKLAEHFAHINAKLHETRAAVLTSPNDQRLRHATADAVNELFGLHMELRHITAEVFGLFHVPYLIFILQWFVSNIRIVQVVMYLLTGMFQVAPNLRAILYLVHLVSYLDTWYMIRCLENVLEACNATGPILRRFNAAPDLQVEMFCSYLQCHPLRFVVCRLFELSRRASFRYIVAIIIQVTVCTQFELAYAKRSKQTGRIV